MIVKCLTCNEISRTFDFCLDIALNIYKEPLKKIVEPKRPATSTKKEKNDDRDESNKIEDEKEVLEDKMNGTTKYILDETPKSISNNTGKYYL